MSDLFTHMLERHQGLGPMVAPRRLARFEPPGAGMGPLRTPEPRSAVGIDVEETRPADATGDRWTPDPTPILPMLPEPPQAAHSQPPAITAPARDSEPPPMPGLPHPPLVSDAPRRHPPEQAPPPQPKRRPAQAAEPGSETGSSPAGMPQPRLPHLARVVARHAVQLPAASDDARAAANDRATPAQAQRLHPRLSNASPMANPLPPKTPARQPAIVPPTPLAAQGPPAARQAGRAVPHRFDAPEPRPSNGPMVAAPETPLAQHSPAGEHRLVPPDWLVRWSGAPPSRGDEPRRPSAPGTAEPTIHVTIGRVEVRAETPPAPPKSKSRQRASAIMSLEAYLNQRQGRGTP